MRKFAFDIFRIGIFLLGVSSIIFASIAVHWYYKIQKFENNFKPQLFHAYCNDKTIIIHANEKLENVSVMDANKNIICEFETIPKNSDEICFTNSTGTFLIKHGNLKKAVICYETRILQRVD
ncbi:MAG: hypothetical protein J7K98_02540 [Candidatus Aenigmarchaeota archaeon]|nr:hypothetical protein [Candidatus Aenigmarchaeota archaeon]